MNKYQLFLLGSEGNFVKINVRVNKQGVISSSETGKSTAKGNSLIEVFGIPENFKEPFEMLVLDQHGKFKKSKVKVSENELLFLDTPKETGTKLRAGNLGCFVGIHAWANGRCVVCGKVG